MINWRKTAMKICDKTLILVGGSTISLGVLSVCFALVSTNLSAQSPSCFDEVNLEPGFIAFTTNKHSKLADWYKRVFDLETAK
jgi:hypothetical protein